MRVKVIEMLPFVESLKLEGRFEEAKSVLMKEIDLRSEMLGPFSLQGNVTINHFLTFFLLFEYIVGLSRLHLAELYKEHREFVEEAKSQYKLSLTIFKKNLKKDHIGKKILGKGSYSLKK